MKVGELIKELESYDPEREVATSGLHDAEERIIILEVFDETYQDGNRVVLIAE